MRRRGRHVSIDKRNQLLAQAPKRPNSKSADTSFATSVYDVGQQLDETLQLLTTRIVRTRRASKRVPDSGESSTGASVSRLVPSSPSQQQDQHKVLSVSSWKNPRASRSFTSFASRRRSVRRHSYVGSQLTAQTSTSGAVPLYSNLAKPGTGLLDGTQHSPSEESSIAQLSGDASADSSTAVSSSVASSSADSSSSNTSADSASADSTTSQSSGDASAHSSTAVSSSAAASSAGTPADSLSSNTSADLSSSNTSADSSSAASSSSAGTSGQSESAGASSADAPAGSSSLASSSDSTTSSSTSPDSSSAGATPADKSAGTLSAGSAAVGTPPVASSPADTPTASSPTPLSGASTTQTRDSVAGGRRSTAVFLRSRTARRRVAAAMRAVAMPEYLKQAGAEGGIARRSVQQAASQHSLSGHGSEQADGTLASQPAIRTRPSLVLSEETPALDNVAAGDTAADAATSMLSASGAIAEGSATIVFASMADAGEAVVAEQHSGAAIDTGSAPQWLSETASASVTEANRLLSMANHASNDFKSSIAASGSWRMQASSDVVTNPIAADEAAGAAANEGSAAAQQTAHAERSGAVSAAAHDRAGSETLADTPSMSSARLTAAPTAGASGAEVLAHASSDVGCEVLAAAASGFVASADSSCDTVAGSVAVAAGPGSEVVSSDAVPGAVAAAVASSSEASAEDSHSLAADAAASGSADLAEASIEPKLAAHSEAAGSPQSANQILTLVGGDADTMAAAPGAPPVPATSFSRPKQSDTALPPAGGSTDVAPALHAEASAYVSEQPDVHSQDNLRSQEQHPAVTEPSGRESTMPMESLHSEAAQHHIRVPAVQDRVPVAQADLERVGSARTHSSTVDGTDLLPDSSITAAAFSPMGARPPQPSPSELGQDGTADDQQPAQHLGAQSAVPLQAKYAAMAAGLSRQAAAVTARAQQVHAAQAQQLASLAAMHQAPAYVPCLPGAMLCPQRATFGRH
jgi:hypothetical protein